MAFGIVDAAAALAGLRPEDIGLADPARSAGWLERQVPRWQAHLAGYQREPHYRGRQLPHAAEIGEWLQSSRPRECIVGIIHGDLQFANVMFAHDRPQLLALVDWELSALGDPLLDLGWILASWSEPGDPPGRDPYVDPIDGFPSRQELVDRYVVATRRDPDQIDWYFTLACFKLAVIVEGTFVRALAGQAPMEVGARLHSHALWLMDKARQLVSR
jgi:aminoglycoside phosphotransferase (APT) family kinase protein